MIPKASKVSDSVVSLSELGKMFHVAAATHKNKRLPKRLSADTKAHPAYHDRQSRKGHLMAILALYDVLTDGFRDGLRGH